MTKKEDKKNAIEFTPKDSSKNLKYLSKQLALNHFHSSTVDLFELTNDSDIREMSKELIKKGVVIGCDILKIRGENFNTEVDGRAANDIDVTRNILVIGAGCSFNSFDDIPLALKMVDLIKEKIIITEFNVGNTGDTKKISLRYLLEYAKDFAKKKIVKRNYTGTKYCPHSDTFLKNQFKLDENHYNIIPEIAKKIDSGMQKWKLTNINQKSNKSQSTENKIDFESFLSIISQVLSVKTVREAIYDLYSQNEGTTLFYSIIAHLFKNRFIDVIINFNFDELLDRAIDDEVGVSGYLKVLSDGDCSPINTISQGGRLRQPLYIKPHGTASHKSTLRFTKDQYQELPNDMKSFLSNLISGQEEEELADTPRSVNLITAGFEMNSIEFNEILIKYLPKGSAIFDIFYHDINKDNDISNKVSEKLNHLKKLFFEVPKERKPSFYPIAHILNQKESYGVYYEKDFGSERTFDKHYCSLGNTAHLLFLNIRNFFNDQFKPRNIDKHLIINALFGNRFIWNRLEHSNSDDISNYPKEYFNSANYFKDRTIIEAFINVTVNDGKIDLYIFMMGIGGYYYSKYVAIKKTKALPILELLQSFNFTADDNNPQSLGIRYLEIDKEPKNPNRVFYNLFEKFISSEKHEFSTRFKGYLSDINQQKCENTRYLYKLLLISFNNLRLGDNSKIHPDFNDLGNHIFKDYNHLGVINTNLANNLYFSQALMESNDINRICIVADNGYQIGNFLPKIKRLLETNCDLRIYLIVQDHFNFTRSYFYQRNTAIRRIDETFNKNEFLLSDLDIKYPHFLNILILPIVEHNRHMVLFMSEATGSEKFMDQQDCVKHAVYCYKKGLSQKINPMRLKDNVNQKYLLQMFSEYSYKAARHLERIRHIDNEKDADYKKKYTEKFNENPNRGKLISRVNEKEFIWENWVFDVTPKERN